MGVGGSVGIEVEVISQELNSLVGKEVVVVSPVELLSQIAPKG